MDESVIRHTRTALNQGNFEYIEKGSWNVKNTLTLTDMAWPSAPLTPSYERSWPWP